MTTQPKKLPHELYFHRWQTVSRFFFARQIYSTYQNWRQRFFPNQTKPLPLLSDSIFAGQMEVATVVEQVRQHSFASGWSLPSEMTDRIHDYAMEADCYEPGYVDRDNPNSLIKFRISEAQQKSYQFGNRQLSRAIVLLPGGGEDASDCPAIEQLVNDSLLLNIAREYLGYQPTRITRHLTFLLPPVTGREPAPAAYWHLDIAGWRPFTFYIYITPVPDVYSGPHILMQGSHRHKPLSLLLSSGCQPGHRLLNFYPKEDIHVVLGERGFAFFEDPSAWHKVELPADNYRLILQLRYS